MLLPGLSALGKTVFRFLKVVKTKKTKSKKQKQEKVHFKGSNRKSFFQSRYGKLIPTQSFIDEKHRSDLQSATSFELNQMVCDKEQLSTVLSRKKHKIIVKSLGRALASDHSIEKKEFLQKVKNLLRKLKVVRETSTDPDLVAMYNIMNDIWKEHDRQWLRETMLSYKQRKKCSSKHSSDSRVKETQEKADTVTEDTERVPENVNESKITYNSEVHTSLPLAQLNHSCALQECLLSRTPSKARNKPYKINCQTNTARDTAERNTNPKKNTSLVKGLNFNYGDTRGKQIHIEAKRLGLSNETHLGLANISHCQAVAELLDQRLQSKELKPEKLICMYVNYQDGSNAKLSQLKYDMLNTCLSAYLFPMNNAVSISWTDKVSRFVSNNTDEDFVTDIFERSYEMAKCSIEAVMVVSKPAADILRHRQLGMLDTVAVILGIPRKSLMIVHQKTLPQLFN